ncbi:MAG: ferrous iron transport protein B [Succiniclasticum sp.]|uniref:ferrous iron transport protein B n=1 Tax=Succiniclasticum sp. TaxID=2775030 RepID=UPI002A909F27|nr:ferrous iron transport protein B [Succiniclasticum sp.]MDY6290912.1 ferrous iron transport protein B [Succiniclasticum sp.]
MDIKIALAGNPNCGKTTLFNELTGSSQYVGNWPGVTVEKKEGRLKGHDDVIIQDLPGIYSLSPYTLEETVTRKYLINERPDVILNIIDGTNLERNLYLTTQLIEVGLPVVIAINMMDLVNKNGDIINLQKLSAEIGAPVYPISALEGKGCLDVANAAVKVAENHQVFKAAELPHVFRGSVEHALAHIEESISDKVDKKNLRWFAIKLFERDEQVLADLNLSPELTAHLEEHIKDCETEMDDDAESIITNQRYEYIGSIIDACITKNRPKHALTFSDKIDQVVTNRFLGLPIFFAIMTLMYYISITTVGGWMTDWTNDVFFGEIVTDAATNMLESMAAPEWLSGLVIDGIIGGVGTVLGFVPQILLIFFFMSLLEDSGYMARVAFIMDRIFRQFGLSGKSFIPVLIGMGCGVPAIMAARTIEEERDRRMTILLSTFIPCGAKAEIIGMITAVFFPDSVFMAPGMYFLGLAIIVLAGIALKKTSWFAGEPAPFVMELPAYHMPSLKGVLIHMWERARGFIIKAGMIIFPICVLLWFMQTYNFSFEMVEEVEESMLGVFGNSISWIFAPIGLGDWKATVASIAAFLAKEDAVGVLAMLAGAAEDAEEAQVMDALGKLMPPMAAFSYMILNLFDPPCLVAMATCYREMGSRKWGLFAICFQAILGYSLAFVFYNLGSWYVGDVPFGPMQGIALFLVLVALYFIFRPAKPYVKPQEKVHA